MKGMNSPTPPNNVKGDVLVSKSTFMKLQKSMIQDMKNLKKSNNWKKNWMVKDKSPLSMLTKTLKSLPTFQKPKEFYHN